MKSLINNEYIGKVLSDKDPKNKGRYKVHIPELMPHLPITTGIWVRNHIHKWRYTNSDESTIYGQYFPIQPGTIVIVKFFEEDFNSGYIDRIVSDQEINSMPLKITDRDDLYLFFRTAKFNNLFVITEETQDQPRNSIHLYFNNYRTTIVIDENGIHVHTDDNQHINIQGNQHIHVNQDAFITVENNCHVLVKNGDCNIDTPNGNINLNCEKAEEAQIPQRQFNNTGSQTSDDSNTYMINKGSDGQFDDWEKPLKQPTIDVQDK